MLNKELLLAGTQVNKWPNELTDTGFWLIVGQDDTQYYYGYLKLSQIGSVSRIPNWYKRYKDSPLLNLFYDARFNETFMECRYVFPSFPVTLEVGGIRASLNRSSDSKAYLQGDVFNFGNLVGELIYVNIVTPLPTKFDESY